MRTLHFFALLVAAAAVRDELLRSKILSVSESSDSQSDLEQQAKGKKYPYPEPEAAGQEYTAMFNCPVYENSNFDRHVGHLRPGDKVEATAAPEVPHPSVPEYKLLHITWGEGLSGVIERSCLQRGLWATEGLPREHGTSFMHYAPLDRSLRFSDGQTPYDDQGYNCYQSNGVSVGTRSSLEKCDASMPSLTQCPGDFFAPTELTCQEDGEGGGLCLCAQAPPVEGTVQQAGRAGGTHPVSYPLRVAGDFCWDYKEKRCVPADSKRDVTEVEIRKVREMKYQMWGRDREKEFEGIRQADDEKWRSEHARNYVHYNETLPDGTYVHDTEAAHQSQQASKVARAMRIPITQAYASFEAMSRENRCRTLIPELARELSAKIKGKSWDGVAAGIQSPAAHGAALTLVIFAVKKVFLPPVPEAISTMEYQSNLENMEKAAKFFNGVSPEGLAKEDWEVLRRCGCLGLVWTHEQREFIEFTERRVNNEAMSPAARANDVLHTLQQLSGGPQRVAIDSLAKTVKDNRQSRNTLQRRITNGGQENP